jgi:ankyrin repeat protein
MLQGWYGSALVSAAAAGDLPMTEFLVNNGATIDMALPSGRFGSALAGAAAGGRVKVVRYLVDEVHANVNLPLITGNYGTALNAASHWGHTECVKILLNAGAIGDNLQPHCGFHTAIDAAQAEICERTEDHYAMTVVWRQPPGRKSIKQINAAKQAAVKLLLEHNDLAESSLEVIDSKAGES